MTGSASRAETRVEVAAPARLATSKELRATISSVAREALEALKWGRPCHSDARGMFCHLQRSTEAHAALVLPKGATLKDPDHLFEGTGKEMRHVKRTSGRSPTGHDVRERVRQAASS